MARLVEARNEGARGVRGEKLQIATGREHRRRSQRTQTHVLTQTPPKRAEIRIDTSTSAAVWQIHTDTQLQLQFQLLCCK